MASIVQRPSVQRPSSVRSSAARCSCSCGQAVLRGAGPGQHRQLAVGAVRRALHRPGDASPGKAARCGFGPALFIVLQAYAELTFASFLAIFAGLAVLFRIAELGLRIWRGRRGGSIKRQTSNVTHHVSRITRHSLVVRLALIAACSAPSASHPSLLPCCPICGRRAISSSRRRLRRSFLGRSGRLCAADATAPRSWRPDSQRVEQLCAAADGSQFPVNKGQQIYVGYVALALAAVGLWSGRRRSETWFWAFLALVFFC